MRFLSGFEVTSVTPTVFNPRPRLGQSFTAPSLGPGSATVLLDFSFFSSLAGSIEPKLHYVAKLHAFDGTAPVGPVLHQSGIQTPPTYFNNNPPFLAIPFTVGVALAPGMQYLFYLDARDFPNTRGTLVLVLSATAAGGGGVPLDVYSGGGVYSGGANSAGTSDVDLAVLAHFATTAAPEPGTWILFGTGLGALLGAGALRRRTTRPS